jgi:hypothetical protein
MGNTTDGWSHRGDVAGHTGKDRTWREVSAVRRDHIITLPAGVPRTLAATFQAPVTLLQAPLPYVNTNVLIRQKLPFLCFLLNLSFVMYRFS